MILVSCAQLNEMKMELHKAKCREGNLERQLKSLTVSSYLEKYDDLFHLHTIEDS